MINRELLDYYHAYCVLTIWFEKITCRGHKNAKLSVSEISKLFTIERDRIIADMPTFEATKLKVEFDKIAQEYCAKVSHWSARQKRISSRV